MQKQTGILYMQNQWCSWQLFQPGLLVLFTALLLFVFFPICSISAEADSANSEQETPPVTDTTAAPPATDKKDKIPLLSDSTQKYLDEKQEGVSTLVTSAAEWLDSFYDDGPTVTEQNETRVTLKLEFAYTDNDSFEFKPRLKVKLKIPKLTKKANLIITASDDEDFEADGNPANSPGVDNNEKTDQLSAALRFFVKEGEKYNISTSVGGSYDYLYAGLRFRHQQNFGSWQGIFTDRLRWYTDDGWENRVSYYLDRKFSERWMFRSITSISWYEILDGVPYSQLFRMYQVLNEENAILYEAGAYFDTEPENYMTDLQFKVRFRKRFYRDWLVCEIAPQVTFPEDHDRDTNLGIILKLEADFGYTSDRAVFDRVFDF